MATLLSRPLVPALTALAVVIGALHGCALPEPTWVDDVEPLMQEHCFSCHGPGDVAGADLTDYETARAVRGPMAHLVENRRMPPWTADDGCNEYEDDRRLSEDEVETLVTWAEGRALHGEDARRDAGDALGRDLGLDRVDVEATMPEEYVPTGDDDYRCFLLPWSPDTETWITGFEASPGDRGIVHHAIAFLATADDQPMFRSLDEQDDGPGWSCFGGPGGGEYSGSGWLGGWAPGDAARLFPHGSGLRVAAESRIVLQVHYHSDPARPTAADRTTLRLRLEDEVEHPGRMQPWADPDWFAFGEMPIPPRSQGTSWTFDYPYWVDAEIHSINLHMHRLGVAARLSVRHPDGRETCLVDISRWDFDQQQTFRLTEPFRVAGGADEIVLRCTWDNPTNREVNWGDGTDDEMCLATMYVIPN